MNATNYIPRGWSSTDEIPGGWLGLSDLPASRLVAIVKDSDDSSLIGRALGELSARCERGDVDAIEAMKDGAR